MRMIDIIAKKKHGQALSAQEIRFFVEGYTRGEIPDYQAAAFLMAVYFQGMNEVETAELTMAMVESGDVVDLSEIPGVKVDKHSTGGVGDKTTLVLGPIVAACGVPVAKMSGRGLGHTGGTLDKLESIPGFNTALAPDQFLRNVKDIGLSVVGQTGNLVPADKKLYALRDVTATVDNISLIASSIMSKKLAAGSDAIVLDVKTGSGAFMKTIDDSIALAQAMVSIGEHVGKRTIALITDMDRPLGRAIGNALEVKEAIATLEGRGPEDLTEVCLHLAANMLCLAGKGSLAECLALADEAVRTGTALEKLKEMVRAQGGDVRVIENPSFFREAPLVREVKAEQDGWITKIDTEACGLASVLLGAGRHKLEDEIDHSAGIVLEVSLGTRVEKGQALAKLYTSDETLFELGGAKLREALKIGSEPMQTPPLIHARVTHAGVERPYGQGLSR
ncbi:MAG: pyrimidine-nucleoside phosphorylase [Limnochordia bacterium]